MCVDQLIQPHMTIRNIFSKTTHFCKIYLLENKNEVFTFLKEYINEAECHFNTKMK
jgi:hypothetical protein